MKRLKKYFNLIEVVLALGVAGIGIAGIMAVVPISMKAAKTADHENAVVDSVNTFFAQLDIMLKKDWTDGFPDLPAERISESDVNDAKAQSDDMEGLYGEGNSKPDDAKNYDVLTADGNGKFKSMFYDGGTFNEDGLYRVWMGRDGSEYPDFAADICMWRVNQEKFVAWQESNGEYVWEAGNYADASDENPSLITVYLEVSWPVTVDYENREKRLFVREYYNPNF